MKSIDLLVYRQYEHKGVKLMVEIDRRHKKVSLVEWDANHKTYKLQTWKFAEREVDYMNGWRLILQAMDAVIIEAKKELEQFDKDDTDKMVQMFIALNKVKEEKLK